MFFTYNKRTIRSALLHSYVYVRIWERGRKIKFLSETSVNVQTTLSLKIHVIAYYVQVGEHLILVSSKENRRGEARGPVNHIHANLFKEKCNLRSAK